VGAGVSEDFGIPSIPDEGTLDDAAWWMWARQRMICSLIETASVFPINIESVSVFKKLNLMLKFLYCRRDFVSDKDAVVTGKLSSGDGAEEIVMKRIELERKK
jgi:hypothetical protein